jgi:uncharacterized protein
VQSLRYFTVALAVIAAVSFDRTAAQNTSASTFRVFVRGADTGSEEVTIMESESGWTLRGSGKMRGSINMSTDYWEARYDRSWKPIELAVSLSENANKWTIRTSFAGTTATSEIVQNGKAQQRTHTVAADTIALPNLVFAAYEVLAARLATAQAGSHFDAYIAPQDMVTFTADKVTSESIQVPGRVIDARRWTLTITDGSAKLEMELWTDGPHLLRLDIPSQMLSVLRDDIASVSARVITLGRPNDEQIAVPANGFSLAATISRPPGVAPAPPADRKTPQDRFPAVVLVSGSSPSDRDEFVAGIPIFAQMANAIADAGYLVVRFDERGAGQSGGRAESAPLDEFAADVRSVVTYLDKRRDVDPKRIALLGYGEGGWVALLVAARETKVAALGLIGVPAISGTELVLEQQRMIFERAGTSPSAQQAAVEQQKKILDAVITGKGWENLTLEVRRQVDTPLYRSFLTFEPAQAIVRVRQPVLVIQPMLDREVPAYHGEQLAQLARSRPRAKTTDFVQLDGVNHLLARATTGDLSEYATLAQRSVTPAATLEIISWLAKTLPAATQK